MRLWKTMSTCLTPLRAVPKDIRPLCTFVPAEPSHRVRAAAGREHRLGYPGVLRAAPSFSGSGAGCSVAVGRLFEPWPSPRITPITISPASGTEMGSRSPSLIDLNP